MIENVSNKTVERILVLIISKNLLREAFIKKKKSVKFFTVGGGGGSNQKNFTVLKVMFKIHFRPF